MVVLVDVWVYPMEVEETVGWEGTFEKGRRKEGGVRGGIMSPIAVTIHFLPYYLT